MPSPVRCQEDSATWGCPRGYRRKRRMSHTMAGTALVGFFRRSLPPLVLLLLLALPDRGHAHPHVFVAYSFDLVFGADGLDGVRMTWEFDDFFSSLLLQTYDANGDGRFSPEETQR